MTTSRMRLTAALALIAAGCSSKASSDGPLASEARPPLDLRRDAPAADARRDGAQTVDAGFLAALEKQLATTFTVAPGSYEEVNGAECCQNVTGCAGNNPTTPYHGFWAPPAPGQTAPTMYQRKDNMSWFLRLRADEALLYVGATPPETLYFGFTPYMWQKGPLGIPVLASLSETLNNKVIATDAPAGTPPFERRTAVIATADSKTLAAVTTALTAAGFPSQAINPLVFDPALSTFGLGATSDTFGVMTRVALFADPAKKAAYYAKPPGTVYRLTPLTAGTPSPLPSPPARPKGNTSEKSLEGAVNLLGLALRSKHPLYNAVPLLVLKNTLDPYECISKPTTCLADNRDTIYPQAIRANLFTGEDEFYMVFGVNHDKTGKTTYSNASVYSADHQYGIKAVTSLDWAGSAKSYLPNNPDVDKLYAYKITRSCNGEPFCVEIPTGGCPTGIDDGKAGSIAFRAYLEPGTNTAPNPDTLVADRILYFHR